MNGNRINYIDNSRFNYTWVEGDDFFGRTKELQLANELLTKNKLILAISERRTGKTSFWHELINTLKLDKETLLVFDIGTSKSVDELTINRQDRINIKLKTNFSKETTLETIMPHIEMYYSQTIKNILFVYDEIVFKNFSQAEQQNIHQILYPVAFQNCSFDVSVIATTDHAFVTSTVGSILKDRFIDIPPLSCDEMEIMLKKTYEKELFFSKKAINLFWQFSGGHPKFAKMLCKNIISTINEQKLYQIPPISLTSDEIIDAICSVIQDSAFISDLEHLKKSHFSKDEFDLFKNERICLDDPLIKQIADRNYLIYMDDHYVPRIKAIHWAVTNNPPDDDSIERFLTTADITINEAGIFIKGEQVPCSQEEKICLGILLQASGQTVLYEDFYQAIQKNEPSKIENIKDELTTIINSLRRRLDEDLEDLEWLLENEGVGYFLRLEDE